MAVYRGGDAISGTVFALLTDGIGLGLMSISLIGAGVASLWAGLGWYLGKDHQPAPAEDSRTPALPVTES